MVDQVVIDVAYRNLMAAAGLEEDAFWREYAAIEDAALFCTAPQEHALVMDMLNNTLFELGKIRNFDTGLPAARKTRVELEQKLSRLAVDLPAILRFTPLESRSQALSDISSDLLASAAGEDQDYVAAELGRLRTEYGLAGSDAGDDPAPAP